MTSMMVYTSDDSDAVIVGGQSDQHLDEWKPMQTDTRTDETDEAIDRQRIDDQSTRSGKTG